MFRVVGCIGDVILVVIGTVVTGLTGGKPRLLGFERKMVLGKMVNSG